MSSSCAAARPSRGDVTARAPRIVAFGGGVDEPLREFVLRLTGVETPRVLYLPTAQGDSDAAIARFYEAFGTERCRPSHLRLFGIPPRGIRELVLAQDLVYVAGGNTANMLAIWRVHGLDTILREAWEAGVVLAGVSAGSICWFEEGVTDSFRAQLDGLPCLGFLPGSNCPHYDGEPRRRPAYRELVGGGFPAGLAADDACGLVFHGTTFAEAVASAPGAGAYRVQLVDGAVQETPLPARMLT